VRRRRRPNLPAGPQGYRRLCGELVLAGVGGFETGGTGVTISARLTHQDSHGTLGCHTTTGVRVP